MPVLRHQGGENLSFQIGGAILDFVVLSILNRQDEYGYLLTQQVREMLDVSETALYPALKRLEKASLLTTYDKPFQGRNRRFYRLTPNGCSALRAYTEEWTKFQQQMNDLLRKD